MKFKTSAAVIAALIFSGGAMAANIPPLPDVDPVTARAKPELAARREALSEERDSLRTQSMKQKAACGAVEEGTPSERDCALWLERITAEVERHVEATNNLAAAISAAAGLRAFQISAIEIQGDVTFVTADGRRFSGQEIAGASIDNRTTVVTGKDSRALMLLPDGTTFTIGAASELVLDDFVYDPDTDMQKMTLRLAKGTFRWVTGKVRRSDPTIDLRSAIGGIRGTDFECFAFEDGSDEVRLYSGEMTFTDKKSGTLTILTGGMVAAFRDSATTISAAPLLRNS